MKNNTMIDNFRRLGAMIRIFSPSSFYSCEATKYNTRCLGVFNGELLLKALKYKFKLEVSPSGFIRLTRGSYSITLTD